MQALMLVFLCFQQCAHGQAKDDTSSNKVSAQITDLNRQAYKARLDHRNKDELDCYKKVLELDPGSAMAHSDLATALRDMGDLESSLQEYKKALQIDPHLEVAQWSLGLCYWAMGDLDQAEKSLCQYQEDHPQGSKTLDVEMWLWRIRKQPHLSKTVNVDTPDYLSDVSVPCQWPPGKALKVAIASGKDVQGFKPEFVDAVQAAFSEWQDVLNNRLKFQFVTPDQPADIECVLVSDMKSFADKGRLGETTTHDDVENGKKFLDHATIKLCTYDEANLRWCTPTLLQNTCLHEIGHALGIVGHSPNYKDVMNYVVDPSGGHAERKLSQRDIATINKVYDNYPPIK